MITQNSDLRQIDTYAETRALIWATTALQLALEQELGDKLERRIATRITERVLDAYHQGLGRYSGGTR